MHSSKLTFAILALLLIGACGSQSQNGSELKRVYKQQKVGTYQNSLDLSDCGGETFLSFMKKKIYPALEAESMNRTSSRHIEGVEAGEGVELRLTDDVTTYHVKYKRASESKAERSGRSFSAVGDPNGGKVAYVADASYAHFFDSFERTLKYGTDFLNHFYSAIFGVLVNCDASSFSQLNRYQKRLAADFIAVYVAEQYRHLLSGKGKKLGRSHQWDDALLQTTMLIAFHAGQKNMKMFYQGDFTDRTYDQYGQVNGEKFCAYKNWNDKRRQSLKKRNARLRDYWQPNSTCERSGVNITRRDFEKMGTAISKWNKNNSPLDNSTDLMKLLKSKRKDIKYSNNYKNIARFFISNEALPDLGSSAVSIRTEIVEYLANIRKNANKATADLGK